jgi:hypothetical protein
MPWKTHFVPSPLICTQKAHQAKKNLQARRMNRDAQSEQQKVGQSRVGSNCFIAYLTTTCCGASFALANGGNVHANLLL